MDMPDDDITVVMKPATGVEEFKRISFDLKGSDYVLDLITKWRTKTGLDPSRYQFLVAKNFLVMDKKVSEYISEADTFVLGVEVKKLYNVAVSVFQFPDLITVIECSFDFTVRAIIQKSCTDLHVPEKKAERARLLFKDMPLEEDKNLSQLDIAFTDDTTLFLDLLQDVQVEVESFVEFEEPDEEEGKFIRDLDDNLLYNEVVYSAVPVSRYLSDKVKSLMRDDFVPSKQRLKVNGLPVSKEKDIGSIVPPSQILKTDSVKAVLELSGLINVQRLKGGALEMESMNIWPSDRVSVVSQDSKRNGFVFWNGIELKTPKMTFSDIGIQNNSMLMVEESLNLIIRCSKGKHRSIRLSRNASVFDLRQMVYQFEEHQDFIVTHDRKSIENTSVPLALLGINQQSNLSVSYDTIKVNLMHEERIAPLGNVRTSMSFQRFLEKASSALNLPDGAILPPDTMFECSCGRKFDARNPFYAGLPKECCSREIKEFTVHRPVDIFLKIDSEFYYCRLPTTASVDKLKSLAEHLSGRDIVTGTFKISNQPLDPKKPLHQKSIDERVIVELEESMIEVRLQFGVRGHLFPWTLSLNSTVGAELKNLEKIDSERYIEDIALRKGNRLVKLEVRRPRRSEQTLREFGIHKFMVLVVLESKDVQHRGCQTDHRMKNTSTQFSPDPPPAPVLEDNEALGRNARFILDCRQARGRSDFSVEVPRTRRYVSIRDIRQQLLGNFPRYREVQIEVRKGTTREGAKTICTRRGWVDYDGNIYQLSDLHDHTYQLVATDDPPLYLPWDHQVWLRVTLIF